MNDYIVFDGVDSRTFGVYLFDRGNDNAPERIYSRYEIPAKNGDLLIDEKRYENVIVQYDLIAFGAGLEGRVQKFKDFMKSRIGYKRLEDSFRPEEYYMACQAAEIEVAYDRERERCKIELTFDRQPQRFLKVGETQVDVDDWKNVKTVSGAIASFDNNEEDVDIKSIVASIVPVQSGSGDPSPTNIRPITGWTGATVTRTGKNLLEPKVFTSGNGITNPVKVDFSQYPSYTFSCNISTDILHAMIFGYSSKSDALGNVNRIARMLGTTQNVRTISKDLFTYEVAGDVDSIEYIVVYFYGSSTTAQDLNNGEIQIEIGSAATAFEPYNGASYPVTWSEAGTVYGGTLDVTTGVLTVTMAMVDLGTLNWSKSPDSPADGFIAVTSIAGKSYKRYAFICSKYTTTTTATIPANLQNGECIGRTNNANFYIRDDSFTTAAAFKTAMSGVQLVYELATPQTYQLTPTEITTLLGQNNVWADCGDVTVEYGKSMGRFKNPSYFDAYPLIRVEGTGTVTIGNNTITISENDGYTDIDCQLMEAYKGSTSRNAYVSFSGFEPPSLKEGVTTIEHSSGITSVKVIPRWWRL